MRRTAFTIVELLVVLLIISLLTGVVAIQVTSIRRSSRDATRLSDVLAIGKAVDQSASLKRGIYPQNASVSGNQTVFCANELAISTGDFTKNKIPQDPNPISGVATGCSNMLDGYTYHSRYGTSSISNIAKSLQADYVIEVGLENINSHDENTFKAQSDVSLPASQVLSESQRHRYFLVGPYCGASVCDK